MHYRILQNKYKTSFRIHQHLAEYYKNAQLQDFDYFIMYWILTSRQTAEKEDVNNEHWSSMLEWDKWWKQIWRTYKKDGGKTNETILLNKILTQKLDFYNSFCRKISTAGNC